MLTRVANQANRSMDRRPDRPTSPQHEDGRQPVRGIARRASGRSAEKQPTHPDLAADRTQPGIGPVAVLPVYRKTTYKPQRQANDHCRHCGPRL